MNLKKLSTVVLALSLLPVLASALTLRCDFITKTSLNGFTAVLSDSSGRLSFDGFPDLNSDLDPSGETVTLNRSEAAPGWIIYSGEEIVKTNSPCVYFDSKGCASPARRFSLNLPESVFKNASTQGSLHFTKLSNYLPGETDYFYSVRCDRTGQP